MKVLHISIDQAVPKMVAANDVYTFNNQLIISKGTKLSEKIITRLKFYSISNLSIFLEEPKLQPISPKVKTASFSQATKNSIEFKHFNDAFVETVQEFKSELNNIANNKVIIDSSSLLEHTTKILSESRNGIHVFDMLHCMREYDDLTYVHSLNVALICNVFGNWLKLSPEDIEVLTLCGLLHDIGKLTLPAALIKKKDSLTDSDFSVIKTHTIKGYQILKSQNIDQRILYTALMHHERCDGSGYPNAFRGSYIDSFAKIVSIVDVYDAMTSARVYRKALSPFEAIRLFESEGYQKYDPHYIMTFLEGIIQSYVGHRVRLSNQSEGEIIMINTHALSKPIVQVGDQFVDLSKEHNLTIEAIL